MYVYVTTKILFYLIEIMVTKIHLAVENLQIMFIRLEQHQGVENLRTFKIDLYHNPVCFPLIFSIF
jgi:hypothetical protein